MNTSSILSIVAALVVSAVGLHQPLAQHGHGQSDPHMAANPHAKAAQRLVTALELSDAQLKSAHEVMKAHHEELGRLAGKTGEQRHQASTEIRTRTQAELRRVLTPEQASRFDSIGGFDLLLGGWMHQMHRTMGQLELSTEQQKRVHQIGETAFSGLVGLLQNRGITDQNRRQRAQALHKGLHDKVHAVLTAGQREKLRVLMQNHHGG